MLLCFVYSKICPIFANLTKIGNTIEKTLAMSKSEHVTYNKAVKQNEQPQQSRVSGVDSLEKKIEALRKLRDNGVITDEEFKSLLAKLL